VSAAKPKAAMKGPIAAAHSVRAAILGRERATIISK
jgi:hypothetical protein